MVRENKEVESSGFDANKNVDLEKTLKDEGLWTGDTIDPKEQANLEPINVRADVGEPEKKG